MRPKHTVARSKKRWMLSVSAVGLAGIVALLVVFSSFVSQTHAAPTSGSWTMYLHDLGHSSFNSAETIIDPTSAGNLHLQWSIAGGSTISTQAVVANGLIYWGSWDGIEHATHLDGTPAWATNIGTTASCKTAYGVVSTATIATVTIKGTKTSVVFVGGGNAQLYALNATTGAILWQTTIGNPPNEMIWSAPVFYKGHIYISTSSFGDCPLIAGKIVKLNANTGVILNTYLDVPSGCIGAGVWASLAINSTDGTLYFVTGNAGTCSQAETQAVGIVKLNTANLSLMSSWQILPTQQGPDNDFGATPTLFTATIGGTVHHLVGAANKNGNFYAFDEANIAAGPIWKVKVAQTGIPGGPEGGSGSISAAAWDGTNLYIGGGQTKINGQSCQGGLRAVNPATGAIVWEQCMTDGPVLGSVTLVPGVVAVGEGTAICLMATGDGHSLFKKWDLTNNSKYYAGPSILNGMLYIGNKDGNFYAYAG